MDEDTGGESHGARTIEEVEADLQKRTRGLAKASYRDMGGACWSKVSYGNKGMVGGPAAGWREITKEW